MRPLHWLVLISLFLTACVTINVYFPAAAAERAADQIIDHVWGKESESLPPHVKPEKPSDSQSFFPPFLGLISTVSADANLDISSPTIQVIKDRMAERHPQLLPYYYNGTIGLTYDGFISLRALQQVPLKARNEVKAMVEQENSDRLALYQEIAVANHHPEWTEQIRKTFAARWIERAPPGWWYQNDKNEWHVKS